MKIEILSDTTIIQSQPCDVFPCKNGGLCKNNLNSYTCTCNAGFSGIDCQIQSSSMFIIFLKIKLKISNHKIIKLNFAY